MNSIKEKSVLKLISLILLPICVAIIIIYSFEIVFVVEYPEIKTIKEYSQTKMFSDNYMSKIVSVVYSTKGTNLNSTNNTYNYDSFLHEEEYISSRYDTLENDNNTIYYNNTSNKYNSGYYYLVITEDGKKAYTNVEKTTKTDTIEKIKEYILSGSYYWSLDKNNINTNLENLKMENIKYDSQLNQIQERLQNDVIYTSFYENANSQEIKGQIFAYELTAKTYELCYILLPIAIIGFLVISIYLVASCGYKKGVENIYLNWFDKLPLELMLLLSIIIIGAEISLIALGGLLLQYVLEVAIMIIIIAYFITSMTALYTVGSIIKRFKSKTFIKNTLTYKIIRWCIKKIKNVCNNLVYNITDSLKIIVIYGGFIIISLILCLLVAKIGFIPLLLLLAFWIWGFTLLSNHFKEFLKIRNALRNIYEGKTDIKLNTNELKGVLKEMSIYINDIAGGLSNAIEQNLKSERLKTELITNVSHDLKTPLTSIINYVDLLKKENIQEEKAKEYIRIIDEKAMRLKKLTEDLVEASKASSGNIKLQKEKLDVKELIQQIVGEFEEKFSKNNLEIITTFPKEDTNITADGKYMSRILENLCGNISKYSMANTRVYIDIIKENNYIKMEFKNMSKDKLNITAEELMQRFVRGDSSRNTEGSGLRIIYSSEFNRITKWKI